MTLKQTTQTIKAAVVKDMTPQSDQHWARLVFGGLMVAGGVFKYVTHEGDWTSDHLIALALMIITGTGVVFTGSIVSLLKAVPVPWKRSPNGSNGS